MLTSVLVIMGQLLVDWGHGRAGGQVANLASRQGKLTFLDLQIFSKIISQREKIVLIYVGTIY